MNGLKTGSARRLAFALIAAGLAVLLAGESRAAPLKSPGKGKYAGMVLVPAGPFVMGRDGGPPEESPAHRVVLPAFYIDRNLVTWADYLPFIQEKGATGSKGEMYLDEGDPDAKIVRRGDAWTVEKGFENYPAAEMAWGGALAYCRWKRKRLPSEAQWEKAARGTDGRLYPWGNASPSAEYLMFGDYRGHTAPVGRYPKGASPFGVNDMAGQVWEWTTSSAVQYPYKPKDGRESVGALAPRVVRGGNSTSSPEGMTATNREVVLPGRQATGHGYIGFRCVASPPHST